MVTALRGDQFLNRVALWVQVRLTRHYHTCDRAQDGNVGTQELHAPHLPNKSAGATLVKNTFVDRCNLSAPLKRRSIHTDGNAVLNEKVRYGVSTATVPSIQDLPIKSTDVRLINGS